jgi:hypothetical protein
MKKETTGEVPIWFLGTMLAVAVLTLLLQGPRFFDLLRLPVEEYLGDFTQEYTSACNWREGLPIYGSLKAGIERHIGRRMGYMYVDYNAHPPVSVVMVLPLAWWDYLDAQNVWQAFSALCFFVSLGLIFRETGLRLPRWLWLYAVAALIQCIPLQQTLMLGQIQAQLLLLLTLAWVADRRGWAVVAGICAGAATALKLYPGLTLFYFLARRQWKAALTWTATMLVLNLLALVILGSQAFVDYVRIVMPSVDRFKCSWQSHSLVGFWWKLFVGSELEYVTPLWHNPTLAWACTLLSAAVIMGIIARYTWKAQTPTDKDRAFGLHLWAMSLLSPVSWEHGLLLLALPLVLWWQVGLHGLPRLFFFVHLALMWINVKAVILIPLRDQYHWLPEPAGPLASVTWLSLSLYNLLAGFIWMVWLFHTPPDKKEPPAVRPGE